MKNVTLYLFKFDGTPYSDAENNTLIRFTQAFEQTYTRFLDLQKAEAQAREAHIEAALERTRTQSMIMQHSKELDDTLRVFHGQVLLLGINSAFSYLWLPDEENEKHKFWATWAEQQNSSTIFKSKALNYPLDRNEPATAKCLVDWKSDQPVHSYALPPGEVENYFANWAELLDGVEKLKPEHFPGGLYYVEAYMKYGCFGVMIESELTEDEKKILGRFAIEFERAYTRFLDLQKAEAQAREAKIEAALEKVRSRSLAMHKAEELIEVASVLRTEMGLLGVEELETSSIYILNDENATTECWYAIKDIRETNGKLVTDHMTLNLKETWVGRAMISFYHSGEKQNSILMQGENRKEWINYCATKSTLLQGYYGGGIPERTYHLLKFSNGYMGAASPGSISTESWNLLQRATSVFSFAYTRFLDLQKAEAQTREAQIEAALEKLRSKTMAMQRSEQLPETAELLFQQFALLGGIPDRIGIGIVQEDTEGIEWWITDQLGSRVTRNFFSSAKQQAVAKMFEAWQQKKESLMVDLTGSELDEWIRFVKDDVKMPIDASHMKGRRVQHAAFFSQGLLLCSANDLLPQATFSLLVRFAKVFEQTYTRFLDLQKAEAQAREATIEAALERVRGKAMAMHNSNDLLETAGMVFTELRKLGIKPMRAGVGLQNKENRNVLLYSATSSNEGDSLSMVGSALLDDHPVLTNIHDTWLRGEDYFFVMSGDVLKTYYEKVTNNFNVPNQAKAGLEHHGYFLSFSEGSFYGYYEQPISEDQIKTLHRFKAIIDLTFRRYLELQKAESIAKDAIRQASLDRVRAEIASMRTTEDLDRITPLVWSELTTLGIPFVRCGVFIMDEQQNEVHTFLSTPDGRAIAAFHTPLDTPGSFAGAIDQWRKQKMYMTHWVEKDFILQADLLVQQGAIATRDQYLNTIPKEGFHLHFLPFLQGMLYVGNTTTLNENDLHLVQSIADAFSTAYARYEDFNKLELAKQQVDKTLTDLKQTQKQLIQSEKMASLGELTAGIAHEIQNPLNFVNNFSEVSNELIKEIQDERRKTKDQRDEKLEDELLTDISQNLEKILHHGKRADGIVKGMLQHSRSSSGVKEPTNINALADEYLRLAFHGLRAKDKSFNAKFETDFDTSIGNIHVIPQDIGRVILNLITNAFYAVTEKKNASASSAYEPTVSVSTKRISDTVEIRVTDNGNGIPQKVLDKIFQPFFTTKPTGQGTGLGLSLSYDIVKAHGGELKVETREGDWATFFIQLPI